MINPRWFANLQKAVHQAHRWHHGPYGFDVGEPDVDEVLNSAAAIIEKAAEEKGVEVADAMALALVRPDTSAQIWCALAFKRSEYVALHIAEQLLEYARHYRLLGLRSEELVVRDPSDVYGEIAHKAIL
jgi:hypothetical protein